MNRGVKEVRKSIMKRKKERGIESNRSIKKTINPFPQEEEKHGYFPTIQHNRLEVNEKRVASSFIVKGILSLILFFGTAFVLQMDVDMLNTPKKWTSYALTEDFPFARVHEWYQVSFGVPLAFTPESSSIEKVQDSQVLPVIGNITEPFETSGTGIMIAPKKATSVLAWNSGVIIFAGNDRETNKTVIVQHADDSKTVYGYLGTVDVHIYQFIEASEKIGSFSPTEQNETVYFSLEKNNEYIDPAQVIEVDDF